MMNRTKLKASLHEPFTSTLSFIRIVKIESTNDYNETKSTTKKLVKNIKKTMYLSLKRIFF